MYFWSLSVSFDETYVLNFESLVTDLGYQANIFFVFWPFYLPWTNRNKGFSSLRLTCSQESHYLVVSMVLFCLKKIGPRNPRVNLQFPYSHCNFGGMCTFVSDCSVADAVVAHICCRGGASQCRKYWTPCATQLPSIAGLLGERWVGGIGEALEMARCKVRTPFLNWSNLFSKIDE
jgi:hypothetical protein